jgi:hypothetical protein
MELERTAGQSYPRGLNNFCAGRGYGAFVCGFAIWADRRASSDQENMAGAGTTIAKKR